MITAIYAIIYILIFAFGAVIGSFLNVLIYRLPKKLNFAKGFSYCPRCKHRLYPKDLIPVFSWLFLKGKCRYCGESVSPRYILVELVSGGLALSLYLFYPLPQAILFFAVGAVLLTIALIDADTQEIPDSLNIAVMVCGIASIWIISDVEILSRLIGIFAISVPLLIIALLISGAFGGGDIKMMASAGFLLGWQNAIVATFIGIILGGIYGIILLILEKKGKKEHFAFGPCLAVGIFSTLLWGNYIINWYLSFF